MHFFEFVLKDNLRFCAILMQWIFMLDLYGFLQSNCIFFSIKVVYTFSASNQTLKNLKPINAGIVETTNLSKSLFMNDKKKHKGCKHHQRAM